MELPRPKNYRGCINYSTDKKKGNQYFVSKDGPFRVRQYKITKEEYKWCNSYGKGIKLWYYKHMLGTAYHFSGENKHPMAAK